MPTKVKRIAAIMLAAMLVNSSILFVSAEDKETEQSATSVSLHPIDIDNDDLFFSSENNYDHSCPCLRGDYLDNETEDGVINIEFLNEDAIIPYFDENETPEYD